MAHRFLEHTADIQVECRGGAFEDLLREAAQAFYEITLECVRDDAPATRHLDLTGATQEELMVRWLQELLFLLETEHFVATRYVFDEAQDGRVSALLEGYICSSDERSQEVKGVAYHGLRIEQEAEGCSANIIFDL